MPGTTEEEAPDLGLADRWLQANGFPRLSLDDRTFLARRLAARRRAVLWVIPLLAALALGWFVSLFLLPWRWTGPIGLGLLATLLLAVYGADPLFASRERKMGRSLATRASQSERLTLARLLGPWRMVQLVALMIVYVGYLGMLVAHAQTVAVWEAVFAVFVGPLSAALVAHSIRRGTIAPSPAMVAVDERFRRDSAVSAFSFPGWIAAFGWLVYWPESLPEPGRWLGYIPFVFGIIIELVEPTRRRGSTEGLWSA